MYFILINNISTKVAIFDFFQTFIECKKKYNIIDIDDDKLYFYKDDEFNNSNRLLFINLNKMINIINYIQIKNYII